MVDKISLNMNSLNGKIIAVLGLSFKPDTDDMRDAPALNIIPELIKNGAMIKAYCPQGMKESKWRLADYADKISYHDDEYSACNGIDGLIIMTEWSQFSMLNLDEIRQQMRDNYLFDLRNVFVDDNDVRSLFKYFPVGQR